MTEHAVVIAGAGPTGLMLASELALAGIDVAIVERRSSQDLIGARAGGLHARTIEVFDQRGMLIGSLHRGRSPRSRASPGPAWTSAIVPRGTPTDLGYGRIKSSASWPTGLANSTCESIADAR